MRSKIIFLIIFLAGCATGASGLLRLQDRELLIHPDKPGLGYPHNVTICKKRKKIFRWMGKKCKEVHRVDFYDFNNKKVRDKLISAGFTCKSPMRFKY